MARAQQIVIVYGVISLLYGFALGIPLSRERTAAPTASFSSATQPRTSWPATKRRFPSRLTR